MDTILGEAKEIIDDGDDAHICDATMLSAAKAVAHYEMTWYGILIAFAWQLGKTDGAPLPTKTVN